MVEIANRQIKTMGFDIPALEREFEQRFGISNPRFFHAPGRVNLIGEHTDYNGGFVLPIAIEQGTIAIGSVRNDRLISIYSIIESESFNFDLDASEPHPQGHWSNYVEGVARSLEEQGFSLNGADLLIESNVPIGAGLSSSAALENVVAFALLKLSGYQQIDRVRMALAGQAAEHHYVGTQCGIMDQFITALGQKNHALLIDCRSLETRPIPINFKEMAIVICDSRVKHALASSAYNQRVEECRQGLEYLRQQFPKAESLRDISPEDFEEHQREIQDEIVLKRVRHVISENTRTLQAAEALKAGDSVRFGKLMLASHESLKNDYEVSCPELDTLVDIARSIHGVAGARMTGGGFGGCTVNLVEKSILEQFRKIIIHKYHEAFGLTPRIYVTEASKGVEELSADTSATNQQTSSESLTQNELNQQLGLAFSQAFEEGKIKSFIEFSRAQMPELIQEVQEQPVETKLHSDQEIERPVMAEIQVGDVRLTISREFGIRLYYREKQITTDQNNIPIDYPWFQVDPDDPEDIAGYARKHVSRGSRGESPWPENQWPQIGGVQQGEQNWPHRDAAFGPYQLRILEEQPYQAITVSRPSEDNEPEKPDVYGVIPRGIFTVTPNSSVLMALQHVNHSMGLQWAPWLVLGFAMPKEGTIKNPSVIFAVPDENAPDHVQDRMRKVWNYVDVDGHKIALINPHAKTLNEPFKKFYTDVNWTMIAMKGMDYVILTRSILQHPEQFFPFLEHGKYFIEVEHTGPKVSPGHKSNVIIQHDFLSVYHLTKGGLQTISSENGRFEQDVRTVLRVLVEKQRNGLLLSNYRST